MCELLGISASNPIYCNKILKDFFSHSVKHPHGWGLATHNENNIFIEKEPVPAYKSTYLKYRLKDKIYSDIVLAHIRYATIGNIDYNNCHPFTLTDKVGRRWTLIHNGTIFDFPKFEEYIDEQKGETDSERIIMYIIHKVNEGIDKKADALDEKERFNVISTVFSEIAKGNKVNLLLYDGDLLYVHTNYKNTLFYSEEEGDKIFATTPLNDDHSWYPVPFCKALAYKYGDLVYSGEDHKNEYVDKPENDKYLYGVFSSL